MSRDCKNPCLTLHQPWASLLVHGIKRVEGRSWSAPIRGRLWIHAAGKVPDTETIKSMEDFYKEIYAVDGITDIKLPEHYPVSKLLGCVDVVGCLRRKELIGWDAIPEGVRLEGQTDFCWLCENPQKLIIPFAMRGYQGVYNLEKKVHDRAVQGLRSVKNPSPVKFRLPDPQNMFSLSPGSVLSHGESSSSSENWLKPSSRIASQEASSSSSERHEKLGAVIAGARAASKQYLRNSSMNQRTSVNMKDRSL